MHGFRYLDQLSLINYLFSTSKFHFNVLFNSYFDAKRNFCGRFNVVVQILDRSHCLVEDFNDYRLQWRLCGGKASELLYKHMVRHVAIHFDMPDFLY